MQILTLLNDLTVPILQDGFAIELGWLGRLIRALIEGIGITGVGIIVFTLILKVITLPFDIYQRVSTRKQTLIMRNMKPELDKLQKQYANDKNMYSQKMMELYKKNGYSMFGACLPMLISLIILIVAFQSLNSYSQYANLSIYQNMAKAYNQEILKYSLVLDDEYTEEMAKADGELIYEETRENSTTNETSTFVIVKSKDESNYIYYEYNKDETTPTKHYKIDTERLYALQKEAIDAKVAAASESEETSEYTIDQACYDYVYELRGKAAADCYRSDPPSFLWIKNIWYPDVSYNSPIQSYSTFTSSITKKVTLEDGTTVKGVSSFLDEGFYNSITSQLDVEKTEANGYYILIVLSIGMMVLSQFIAMRSQKEANQYQTVDGSGASQQKMMMIIMPLIYCLFAFMYSAAFSIYMTMSSFITIIVTLLCNLIIGKIFNKKEEEALIEKYTRTAPKRPASGNNTKTNQKGRK